jgi:hypothetical protein
MSRHETERHKKESNIWTRVKSEFERDESYAKL